jgi:hypothetical protein
VTVTSATAGFVRAELGIVPVTVSLSILVTEVRVTPFHVTAVAPPRFWPVTVIDVSAAPAATDAGAILVTTGTGGSTVTSSSVGLGELEPAPGTLTITSSDPGAEPPT